jgi:predicted RND superfamily exporter protein
VQKLGLNVRGLDNQIKGLLVRFGDNIRITEMHLQENIRVKGDLEKRFRELDSIKEQHLALIDRFDPEVKEITWSIKNEIESITNEMEIFKKKNKVERQKQDSYIKEIKDKVEFYVKGTAGNIRSEMKNAIHEMELLMDKTREQNLALHILNNNYMKLEEKISKNNEAIIGPKVILANLNQEVKKHKKVTYGIFALAVIAMIILKFFS